MNKIFFHIVTLTFSCFSIGFLGCNSQSKTKLILGEWQFEEPKYDKTGYDKNEVFVFFKNSIFWHAYKSGDTLASKIIGDYSFTQDGKFLELALAEDFGGSKDSTEIIELTNETLVLKAKIGKEKLILKKIRKFKE